MCTLRLLYMTRLLRFLFALAFLSFFIPAGNAAYGQTASITKDKDSGCSSGLTVQFGAPGGATSYSWTLDNGSASSSLQNPSKTYNTVGWHIVTLTMVSAGGVTTTAKDSVRVYGPPGSTIGGFTAHNGVTSGCAPFTPQFDVSVQSNAPGGISYIWYFGDGSAPVTSTSASGTFTSTHTYTQPGTYNVQLYTANGVGCDTTFIRNAYIKVNPLPVAGFTTPYSTYCGKPATIAFTSTATGSAPLSYTWTYGDGGSTASTTSSTVSHTYTSANSYTVVQTVTDGNGCTATATGNINIVDTAVSFVDSVQACQDASTPFVNTTPGTSGAYWNFGDGSTFTGGPTVSHAFAAPGTYTVTMTTTVGGCQGTAKKNIFINPKPLLTMTQSPSIPCPAPTTVTFTGGVSSGPTPTVWNWDFGNGVSDNTQTASTTYTANGHYTVKLTATTGAGCTDSAIRDTVVVRNIITWLYPTGSAAGCVPFKVDFSLRLRTNFGLRPADDVFILPFLSYPYVDANYWKWDFGDGSPYDYTATPSHTYSNVGTYKVYGWFTTSNGCMLKDSTLIHADTKVAASFTVSSTSVCPNELVTFFNTTSPVLTGVHYTWTLQGTKIETNSTNSVSYSYEKSRQYTIQLIASHNGCADSMRKVNYITVNPSSAEFEDSVYCSPSTRVQFLNRSLLSSSQVWIFSDGTTDTAFNPLHTFPDTGIYIVRLATYNSTYGCRDTAVNSVHIARPRLAFVTPDTLRCLGQFTTVRASFYGTGKPTFSYLFGNYQTAYSEDSSSFYQWNSRGRYDVTLIVSSGQGCFDTLRKPNLVLVGGPQVAFGAAQPIGCEPLTTSFTDSSTDFVPLTSRRWKWNAERDPADTTSTTLKTISHTYPLRGLYNVALYLTDSLGCQDSLIRYGYIEVRKPKAKFGTSADTTCLSTPIFFLDSSSGATSPLSYRWSFGDGSFSTAPRPQHSYTSTGAYTVRLIVTDSTGCSDTALYPRTIFIRGPHAAFSPSRRIGVCPQLPVSFVNNSSGALSYLWNFGDGTTPVGASGPTTIFNNYSGPGVFVPYLVATDQYGCRDTARDTIRLLGYPGGFRAAPTAGCAPLEVVFSVPFGDSIPTLTWDFADGTTLVTNRSTSVSHTYTQPGGHLPSVTFSDPTGCRSTSVGIDTIRVDKLTAHFFWDSSCAGVPFRFYDSSYALYGPPERQHWTFAAGAGGGGGGGAGDTASGTPVTHTYASGGSYAVTLRVSNGSGCTATETREVFINYLPKVDAGPDSLGVCPDDSVRLAGSGAVSYVWSPAADLSCASCDSTYGHRVPGWYYVSGTDGHGCVNKDSIRAFIQIKTTSSVGGGGEICQGDTFRLSASGAQYYQWSPAEFLLDAPSADSPLSRPPLTTTFLLLAQKSTCLVDSERVTVVVHPRPYFDAGPDQELRLGSSVVLQGRGTNYKSIAWDRDTTLSCLDCLDPEASPRYTTVYRATFTDIYGCRSSDSVRVRVHCNGSLVYIPNTFTPNGDGQNDVFYPRGEGVGRIIWFRVYDRWGQQVYERMNIGLNDPGVGWDGTYRGQALPPDVYYYTMTTHCDTGEPVDWKGDITLIR